MIDVKNLTKTYRITKKDPGLFGCMKSLIVPTYESLDAVKGISFSIHEGECTAFLGLNGAGKSTTIKMLSGILYPTSGEILVNGKDPFRNRMENSLNIGVVFGQKSQLWWDLPVIETLKLTKKIYQIPKDIYTHNMEVFSKLLELTDFLSHPAKKLSLGQRVRADIAVALLHNPSILYLDEPTIGVDILTKEKIYCFLHQIVQTGDVTIILTSHDMRDLEALCSRFILIDHGTIIFDGNLKELHENAKLHREITYSIPAGPDLTQVIMAIFERKAGG